mmetsp:Transcript_3421/g.8034  ORF Transcript_3421/g.8034 Transcript_3421/m.8034 type:complete len:431 (+) Transcript_3421:63-1355(+)|eukprot:CAMPEP_0114527728 /NCGR_PEP_ID=MMETSP0109-20121206/23788_1 /TAXON_ID=29199 /ORGANISM="Chlorarachnion reptans, Strain CCCM449" /LENGTH=430 /DNA_ID=CAMNT_0001709747 /DNA_START=15 /DNA_END=1307 /DNA_ORIENTATION=+
MPLSLLLTLAAAVLARADNYAVLVAGSSGYGNYRHQADVCHAYQIVIRNGINPDNVIVMSYDDAANSFQNPFKGQLFNKPTDEGTPGVDVYSGCKIDYSGRDVTPSNFLAVLTGDTAKASGKVLTSGADDRVFINFVDHGAPGLIAFPSGELHADDLLDALKTMNENKMYKELVFYLEACESGSMFQDLPDGMKIFATTAANGHESSWGTYCPPSSKVNGKNLNTCLGDLYSVNWMEDADKDSKSETLEDQYTIVKNETTKSHVMQFGETDMESDLADAFWGKVSAPDFAQKKVSPEIKEMSSVDSRDAGLMTFFSQYLNSDAKDLKERRKLAEQLINEIQLRQWSDELIVDIAETAMATNNGMPKEVLEGHRKPHHFDCHRAAIAQFKESCGIFTDYMLKHVRVLVNLCEVTKSPETIKASIKSVCEKH